MAWEQYEKIITAHWVSLLKSDCRDEAPFQEFFECHPCMMPGAFGLIGTSGHSPYPSAIISQPILPDFTRKIPEFMWIARDSGTLYPILIEIEAPAKPWFTKTGGQSSKLTQARDQITEWKTWFENPLNRARFKDYYRVVTHGESLRPLFILVYGRRSEANRTIQRQTARQNMVRDDEIIMTYDRLVPQAGAKEFFSVRVGKSGYRALYIPPTATLGPKFADERKDVTEKDIAIRRSPYFSPERREFLLSRLSYWDDWSRSSTGLMHSGDKE